jgi:hypothetical protein
LACSALVIEKEPTAAGATMNLRLGLDNLPIYGRDNEITALHKAVERVNRRSVPEVIFFAGGSGNEKTLLGNVLNAGQENCFFVAGHCDKNARQPYSAFVDALSDLCEKVASSKDAYEYKLSLLESLGDEEPSCAMLCRELRAYWALRQRDVDRFTTRTSLLTVSRFLFVHCYVR